MRSAHLRPVPLCVLLAAAVVAAPRAWPQSGSAAPSTQAASAAAGSADTYRFHGVVVDSRTGKPIARALVEGYGDRLATLTDHEGRFSLTLRFTAPEGDSPQLARQVQRMGAVFLGLSVRKPGYVSRTPAMTSTVPLSALDQDVVLKLTPQSVIEGRVAAVGEDHPESVRISLLSRRAQEGYARWMQVAGTSTNSRGEYRFADLQPGEYKLTTAEWSDTPNQSSDFTQPVSRYAPVSYPAGAAGGSGPGIHLGGGEVVPVNLNLHPETFFPVRIPVAIPAGGNNGLQVRVQRTGSAAIPVPGFTLRYNARDKVVEGVLPTGAYEVALQTNGPNATASATVALAVQGAAVEIAPVTLLPTVSIPVIVHQDYTHADTASGNTALGNVRSRIQAAISSGVTVNVAGVLGTALPVQVALAPAEMVGASVMLSQRPEGDTPPAFEHVPAGTYRVTIFSLQGGYVAAATSGGTDLLQDTLAVSPSGGAAPIEITLRDDAGTVKGTIDAPASDAGNVSSLYIVAVPSQPSTQRLPQLVVGPSGRFTLFNVPPGSYRIFASRQPFETLEYRSEEFMKRNGGKGVAVTVGPNGSETVTLTTVLDEEP